MATVSYDSTLKSELFYPAFDTLSGMDAKKDLINVNLNEKLGLLDQFVEWIKSFIYDDTKLCRKNINLIRRP